MIEVTAAVILRDHRILLARRGQRSKLAGLWELPGGKVEPGETRQECLERELSEELGVVSVAAEEIAESEYHYDHGSFKIIAIKTTIMSTDFSLTVHDAVEWVDILRLQEYQLAPADVALVARVQELYGHQMRQGKNSPNADSLAQVISGVTRPQ